MNDEQKKVIVSGVTGQDGSYMVDYLLANTPHLVYGMVRRTAKPDFSNLAGALNNPRFQFVTGDLSDTTSIDNVVRQILPDYFINFAAQSFVKVSWEIPEQTFDVGAAGVLRCLEAIRKHVPQCRFYQASSSEEYGKIEYSPQDELHPMRPQSPYGAAKCAGHHLVRVYRESYGLYAVAGTLYNHESERRSPEFVSRKITLGVARIAAAIKAGQSFEPLELGNLDAKRDWSHAIDFIDGVWKMLNQEKPNEFVLASGETHTVREFTEKAFAAAGVSGVWWDGGGKGDPQRQEYILGDGRGLATKAYVPLVRVNPAFYRCAEVDILQGNAARARAELGWSPKISFDELVRLMVQHDLRAAGLT
jgi:GDPmannose 4,6-dehydratase